MSPTALATGPDEDDGAGAGAAAGAGAGAAAFGAASAGAPSPARSSTTSTWPTGTVSPTLNRRSATLPLRGEPIVTVALSVITSTMSWFSLTVAPSSTNQLTISPSVTPSPMSGSLNSNFDILLSPRDSGGRRSGWTTPRPAF